MSKNQAVNNETIKTILHLWENGIPVSVIARAIPIKYATIAMYCRGFKATYTQLSPKEIVAKTLEPLYDRTTRTPEDIINHHLARG